jgi:hypothetical protein
MGHFYDVNVYRYVDEEDGEVWWGAEAGLADQSVGVEHEHTKDLQTLIHEVQDDTIGRRERWPDLRVRFVDDRGQRAAEFFAAVRAAGITLPRWVDLDGVG